MKTLAEVKAMCEVDGKHWIWGGALERGAPRIWAPDYTRGNGECSTQHGRRAVWHIKHQKAVPEGMTVYISCGVPLCVSPHCLETGTKAEWGKSMSESGRMKRGPASRARYRIAARKFSRLSETMVLEIISSNDTGRLLAQKHGISEQLVSKVRKGRTGSAFLPVGGMFTGLLR